MRPEEESDRRQHIYIQICCSLSLTQPVEREVSSSVPDGLTPRRSSQRLQAVLQFQLYAALISRSIGSCADRRAAAAAAASW